jgi:hypothetical protein
VACEHKIDPHNGILPGDPNPQDRSDKPDDPRLP